MLTKAVFTVAALISALPLLAQSNTDTLKVTSPIRILETQLGADLNQEPYNSGKVTDLAKLLHDQLKIGTDKTTIIHLLRWKDPEHTQVKFQRWYLYEPHPSKTSFYLLSHDKKLQTTAIEGRTALRFVYIHLNSDLSSGTTESILSTAGGTSLRHPISYTITITKQDTQFFQDLRTVLQIVGFSAAAAATPQPGYWSVSDFNSQWSTSTITVAASLDSNNKSQGKAATNDAGVANQLSSNKYYNEKPSWIGLSAGVPLKSYKDVTFQSTSNTLTPSTITKQDAYVMFDAYLPPVLPSLSTFRYIPHPFFGLPIKGKVLRHTMLGAGVGLRVSVRS